MKSCRLRRKGEIRLSEPGAVIYSIRVFFMGTGTFDFSIFWYLITDILIALLTEETGNALIVLRF